jgi:hypothetical protein
MMNIPNEGYSGKMLSALNSISMFLLHVLHVTCINETDYHDITEILLKVALKSHNQSIYLIDSDRRPLTSLSQITVQF